MIEVRYQRAVPSLAVTGHAQYAEPGQDIVCAAASALMNAAAVSLQDMDKPKNTLATAKGGKAFVSYVGRRKDKARVILDTVVNGYRCIEEQYPENIRVEGK